MIGGTMLDDEPYTLGPSPDAATPPRDSPPALAPPPPPELSPYQTMLFAAMWIPSLLSVVVAAFAIGIYADNVLGWVAFACVLYLTAKLGARGWGFFTKRTYWAGFVSGFSGFVFIPVYLVAGLIILGEVAELSREASLPAPIEKGVARAGFGDLTFAQAGFNSDGFPSFPQQFRSADAQSRWEDCFDELYVGSGAISLYERAVKRASFQTRNLMDADPETLVVQTLTDVCIAHSKSERLELGPYFNRAVTNAIKDEKKRRPAACRVNYLDPIHDAHSEISLDLKRVLCTLDTDEQQILAMDLAGLDGPEIAEELNISESAARKRLERARDSLRTAWFKGAKGQ